ncbi:hypothetical protein BC567DRAFT_237461 [Phyllosticta citribraziliensis]
MTRCNDRRCISFLPSFLPLARPALPCPVKLPACPADTSGSQRSAAKVGTYLTYIGRSSSPLRPAGRPACRCRSCCSTSTGTFSRRQSTCFWRFFTRAWDVGEWVGGRMPSNLAGLNIWGGGLRARAWTRLPPPTPARHVADNGGEAKRRRWTTGMREDEGSRGLRCYPHPTYYCGSFIASSMTLSPRPRARAPHGHCQTRRGLDCGLWTVDRGDSTTWRGVRQVT